jgi:signal peptidase I
MEDTLLAGDYVFTDKIAYHFRDPRPGEIVTFTYPYRNTTRAEMFHHLLTGKYGNAGSGGLLILIKRVVGVPGDTLQIKDGVLHRNGEAVDEPYVKTDAGDDWGPYTVPPDSYFVMGDNRGDSADSRYIGPVPRRYVRGRATLVYFSVAPARHRRSSP